jgi:hypothetical protein
MAQDGYPADPRIWSAFKSIEQHTVGAARWSVFTTPGAARVYENRYPRFAPNIRVLPNGYDEASFAALEGVTCEPLTPGATTLLHSGVVYPSERDPTCLFEALERLLSAGKFGQGRLKVRFRASGNDAMLNELARRPSVAIGGRGAAPTEYRHALAEMLRADGLLILQAANCNEQIPAKLYEYLRAGRPILALTDPSGDTAGAVRDAGIGAIARLDSTDDIAAALDEFRRCDPARSGGAPASVGGLRVWSAANRRAISPRCSKRRGCRPERGGMMQLARGGVVGSPVRPAQTGRASVHGYTSSRGPGFSASHCVVGEGLGRSMIHLFRSEARSPALIGLAVIVALALGANRAHAFEECGELGNAYGPFDYRTSRDKLAIVEIAHFTPDVEALRSGNTGQLGGDLDYTLRTSPNHARALIAMANLGPQAQYQSAAGREVLASLLFRPSRSASRTTTRWSVSSTARTSRASASREKRWSSSKWRSSSTGQREHPLQPRPRLPRSQGLSQGARARAACLRAGIFTAWPAQAAGGSGPMDADAAG